LNKILNKNKKIEDKNKSKKKKKAKALKSVEYLKDLYKKNILDYFWFNKKYEILVSELSFKKYFVELKDKHKTFEEYLILKKKHQKDIKKNALEIINDEKKKELVDKKEKKFIEKRKRKYEIEVKKSEEKQRIIIEKDRILFENQRKAEKKQEEENELKLKNLFRKNETRTRRRK